MARFALPASIAIGCALVASPALAKKDPEAALAERLEGYEAGEPVKCLPNYRLRNATIYDETAIVYRVGSTLYVNRPRGGAKQLDDWDIMVTTIRGGQLCSVDTVEMRDRSGFYSGTVFLGEFVPYRKVEEAG